MGKENLYFIIKNKWVCAREAVIICYTWNKILIRRVLSFSPLLSSRRVLFLQG